ncbi:hypothetical protein OpiT1DRAFT_01653 [Opitutaceae bacterium TAV1]|nr:hypothetical protein OpiT1DRAFT_01653 [Opitutaceae bacterium TAV1]
MLFMGLIASFLTARTWTDTQGRTVEAEFVSATQSTVTIRRDDDGRTFDLPLDRLSETDRAWVAARIAGDNAGSSSENKTTEAGGLAPSQLAVPVEEFNALFGLPLLADDNLWDDEPASAAGRLRLPEEGRTSHFESYRVYPRNPVPVLGASAYTVALQASEGRITAVTFMFANRGDYPAFAGVGSGLVVVTKAALRAFEKTLEADFEKISGTLTARLGEPRRESAAGSLDTGRKALRWENGPHALLLAHDQEQMVSLKIVPVERTVAARLASEQLRRLLESRITRRANGDVILDQVPMISQGPKGYCVPATFERYLRYVGIPADMYELAMVADTNFGGGTTFAGMAGGIDRYVRRQGRSLERVSLKLTPAGLARYIDGGYPVIWGLFSTDAFNRVSSEHTRDRSGVTDWAAWKKTVSATAKKFTGTRSGAHACLIIGYNRATNEIAFTDSWGPDYAERWVPAEVAQKISQDEYWMISR